MRRVWEVEPGDYRAAVNARKEFVAAIRDEIGPHVDLQPSELIFAELVNNALIHGRDSVQARLDWGAQRAILSVEDGGAGFALSRLLRPSLHRFSGRGLFIVHALARSLQVAFVARNRFRVTVQLPV